MDIRLREKVDEILGTHQAEPIAPAACKEMDNILERSGGN